MNPPLKPPVKPPEDPEPQRDGPAPGVETLQRASKMLRRVLGTVSIRKVEPPACAICGEPVHYEVVYWKEGPRGPGSGDRKGACSWGHVEVVVHQIGEGKSS